MRVTMVEDMKTPKIPMSREVRQEGMISPEFLTIALDDTFKSYDWQNKRLIKMENQ